jgi:molybdate transport system ATP-binding protein
MTISVNIRHELGGFTLAVEFAVAEPGVTVLFGRSGAGKSQTVQAIAGLTRPNSGVIEINGQTVLDTERRLFVPPRRRRVGYVFQDSRLFPHMSVNSNLLYGWRRNGRPGGVQAVSELVELLGIGHLLERRPSALSGGERQRIALGRALLANPQVLLLDEPMAALDAERKAEIMPYLERLRDEARIPILYVSHSLEEVTRLADHMILMVNGRAAAQGAVYDVMARLDLFPFAELSEGGAVILMQVEGHLPRHALTRLAFAGGKLVVPEIPVAAGENVRVRLKAADVMLSLAEPDRTISANNVLKAVVTEVRQDAGAYADVQLACGDTRLISRITRLSAERLALRPGLEVFAIIKAVSVNHRAAGGGVTV